MTGRIYRQTARAEAAEMTRRRIAEAFVDCWRERWFDEITLDEVAFRAKVSVRTVIRQFGNKEGLIAGFIKYLAPEVRERRTVTPGDIDQAIDRLFENYEADGDATIRALAQEQRHPALGPMINIGRVGHRSVTELNFAPWLDPLSEPQRRRALDALVIVTDIFAWKLLRRDMGRSEQEARWMVRTLVQSVLAEFRACSSTSHPHKPANRQTAGNLIGFGMDAFPNLLGKTWMDEGSRWVFSFANGLVVHTDPFMRRDAGRILPVGGPQDMVMNRLTRWPEIVREKRVLDVFAGSGILGLMALRLGAATVDFVDINPRAVRFIAENCARNGIPADRYNAIEASVATYAGDRPYELLLANPPFVVTPPGIMGTLTSAAGADGNALTDLLMARMERLLTPEGEAYVFIAQLVVGGEPLIARSLPNQLRQRTVIFTQVQEQTCPIECYVDTYLTCFAPQAAAVRDWEQDLRARFGTDLGVQHYIMRVMPRGAGPTTWSIALDLQSQYGSEFGYPAASQADMALGRVMENIIPPGRND